MKRKAASNSSEAAFSFTDLLGVLVALFLLTCVVLPALARPQGQIKIAQCADNLRQLSLGIMAYGHDNGDRLPSNTPGFWLWDTARTAVDALQQCGVKRDNFYCPGFPAQNNDLLWNYSGTFRVIGYSLTLPGEPSLIPGNANSTLTPQPTTVGVVIIGAPAAAQRPLVADATISLSGQTSTNPATQATYNFNNIFGGWGQPHRSPHLLANLPAGGNIGMLDGHVEWRLFGSMVPRTSTSGATVFWW